MAPERTDAKLGGWADDGDDGEDTPDATGARGAVGRSDASRVRAHRTERALLQTRVELLERLLEHKDEQLQSVVDQYERVLAERERERRARRDRDVGGGVEIQFEEETETEAETGRLARVVGALRSALGRLSR